MSVSLFNLIPGPAAPTTRDHGDWRMQAACLTEDPETWFPVGDGPSAQQQAEEAKAVCRHCPVQQACLQWAMDHNQQDGIWGGLTDRERYNLRARQTRASRGAVPRPNALPRYATAQDAYTVLAQPTGDHVTWTGPNEVRIDGVRQSPNQVGWRATRDRLPVGRVFTDCDHDGCVQHLTDQVIRDERAVQRQRKTPEPPQCGTSPGYRAHRARGETACQPCKDANADADRRLRNTGTTKPLTERSAA